MKKIVAIALVLIGVKASAQTELTAFTATGIGAPTTFVTDYQALGINPANLGWNTQFEGKRITFGFFDFGASVYSEALAKPVVRESFGIGNTPSLKLEDKIKAAEAIIDEGLLINTDINWLGFSFTTKKLGGFAFSVRERIQSNLRLGRDAADILMLGFNSDYFDKKYDKDGNETTNPDNVAYGVSSNPKTLAQLFDNTNIGMYWYREYNLGYGKRIINNDLLSLYGGIGLKFMQGIGAVDISSNGSEFTAFSSLSPGFGVNYGQVVEDTKEFTSNGSNFNSVGNGFGTDLGVNIVLLKKIKIGMALNGVGSIKWVGNSLTANNKILDTLNFGGVDNANIYSELAKLVEEDGLFDWEQSSNKEKVISIPSTFRFGASYHFSKIFQVGSDITLPANNAPGNLTGAVFGAGAAVKPLPWFRLSAGYVTGVDFKDKYPVGITFIKGLGVWESGIASRDIVSFFTDDGTSLSLVTGFLRFRI